VETIVPEPFCRLKYGCGICAKEAAERDCELAGAILLVKQHCQKIIEF